MLSVVLELDTRGLNCPMPLLKAKQRLNSMQSGQCLQVVATDQGSWRDFHVFTQHSGDVLLERKEENGLYTYLIQKK